MGWKETIINAHRSVTDCVSHYERLKSDRYFVWQEDGENALEADNAHKNTAITGTTDLYTKQEFDPWIEAFESALDAFGVSWYLNDGGGAALENAGVPDQQNDHQHGDDHTDDRVENSLAFGGLLFLQLLALLLGQTLSKVALALLFFSGCAH